MSTPGGRLRTAYPLADYRAAFRRPSVRAAMIADYRAAPATDLANDAADRIEGRLISCPVLSIWADERLVAVGTEASVLTAADVWRRWATDVSGLTVPCGYLIPEHASAAVVNAVLPFLRGRVSKQVDVNAKTYRCTKGKNAESTRHNYDFHSGTKYQLEQRVLDLLG